MSLISKIDVLGDSILKGVIFDEVDGRYRLLKTGAVAAFSQLFHIEVKNHSHFGCTAPKALANLERTFRTGFDADVVLLEFGGNDCDFNWSQVSDNPDGDHQPNTPYDIFIESMQSMIEVLLAKGIRPVLMNLPPIDSVRFFDWITKPSTIIADNVLQFIGEKDFIYRHQERYSLAISRIASDNKLLLIDVRDAFLKQKYVKLCMCADGIHPNEKGQQLIQDVFAAQYLLYSGA